MGKERHRLPRLLNLHNVNKAERTQRQRLGSLLQQKLPKGRTPHLGTPGRIPLPPETTAPNGLINMGRHSYRTNISPSSDNARDDIKGILDLCDAEVTLHVTADFHHPRDEQVTFIEIVPEEIVFNSLKSVFGSNPEIEHYLTDANGTSELVTITDEIKKKIMEFAKDEYIRNWHDDDYEVDAWNSYHEFLMSQDS
jgi:hypothetical protein